MESGCNLWNQGRRLPSEEDQREVHQLGVNPASEPGRRLLQAPLCLQFPKGFPLASASLGGTPCPVTLQEDGVYLDLPLQAAFRDGIELAVSGGAPLS